jgi:hypothetical protein
MAQSVLDYAEAGNSLPWCIRDATTDAVWDWRKHPEATFGGDQSRAREPHSCQAFGADFGIQLDAAHAPNGFALAFLMTGDVYHLEAAQMAANWLLGSDPDPRGGLVKEKVDGQQTRGAAWALNNLVHAWHCTHHAESLGAEMPDWIQPGSYWADRLDFNRADFETFYLRNAPRLRKIGIFHSATSIGNWSTWQESFLCLAAGLAVYYGKEDWRPFLAWKMEGVINRYNNTSGWPRSRPFPRIEGQGYMRAGSWQTAGDWAQLAAAQMPPLVPTADGNLDQGYDTHYLSFDRGVLALAAQLGVAGAESCYDWLDAQMKSGRYTIIDRWAFAA